METTLFSTKFCPRPKPGFVGRQDILSKIGSVLLEDIATKCSKNGKIFLITGEEGVGKSELARLIVFNFMTKNNVSPNHQNKRSSSSSRLAIWINLETVQSVRRDFEKLAGHLFNLKPQLKKVDDNDDDEIFVGKLAQKIYTHLSDRGLSSLFIFDNVQQTTTNKFDLSTIFPTKETKKGLKIQPVILITSRITINDEGCCWQKEILKEQKYLVENLSVDESIKFFFIEFSLSPEETDGEVVLMIEKICKNILNGSPLALTLAAGWIKGNQDYGNDVISSGEKLKTSLENFVEQFDSLTHLEGTDEATDIGKIIFQNIFDQLEDLSVEALNVIKQLALFSVDNLRVKFCHKLLKTALPNSNSEELAKDFDGLLEILRKFNLIVFDDDDNLNDGGTTRIRIQNSVQKFAKDAQHGDPEFAVELAKPLQKMMVQDQQGQDSELIDHVQSVRNVLEEIWKNPNCHPITRDQCQEFIEMFQKYQTRLPLL